MKIVCDCGNEMDFVKVPEGDDEESIEEKGSYVKVDWFKFGLWSAHDEIGMVCRTCNKSIWCFT